MCVGHSGTHELSALEWPKVEAALATAKGGLLDDMTVCRDLRRRIHLKGNGPRSLVIYGSTAYVAQYCSDDIQAIDVATGRTSHLSADQIRDLAHCVLSL